MASVAERDYDFKVLKADIQASCAMCDVDPADGRLLDFLLPPQHGAIQFCAGCLVRIMTAAAKLGFFSVDAPAAALDTAMSVAQDGVANILAGLDALASMLRETAAGLDDKTIHPAHAANRLRKMARGIDGGK